MRTFLAFEIPPDVVTYLSGVTDTLARQTTGVRWVRKEGIHVTVKFLGETEEAMVEKMHTALIPLGRDFAPIRARLKGLDAFPSRRRARVIVVTLEEGTDTMVEVFSRVEESLALLGMEREDRPLVPHITLGRRKVPAPFPDGDLLPIAPTYFTVDHLVLFRSTLTPGGAIYNPLWKIKLGG